MLDEERQRPILIFVDWDSTLTTASTLTLITSIQSWPNQHPNIKAISEAYVQDMQMHEAECPIPAAQRPSLEQESTYLESLTAVEAASLKRIEDAGMFRDVDQDMITKAARDCISEDKVSLRRGWTILVTTKAKTGKFGIDGKTHIISVAWSEDFIASCLEHSVSKEGELDPTHVLASVQDDVTVHANTIDGTHGRIVGSARQHGRLILTAKDKYDVMRQVISEDTRFSSPDPPMTFYIGDSVTDLICLLNVDVGVCIRDTPMTKEQEQLKGTLQRLGVEVRPMYTLLGSLDQGWERGKVVWFARDFMEIMLSGVLDPSWLL